MKFDVIVSGQIRNRKTFENLLSEIVDCKESFGRVIFSSWSDQLDLAKKIIAELGLDIDMKYSDCGYMLPIPANANRNFISFFAQFQQISSASDYVTAKSGHVIRLRADFDVSGKLAKFVHGLAEAFTKNPTKKSLLLGGRGVPFFFEDRILVLSVGHYRTLASMSLVKLFSYDRHNLFPELIFFTAMIGADREHVAHDFRYREDVLGLGKYTRYDVATFGSAFNDYIEKYLRLIFDKFVFLKDVLDRSGRADIYTDLLEDFLPQYQYAYSEAEYRSLWEKEKASYAQAASLFGQRSGETKLSRRDVVRQKADYEELQRNYWSGDSAAVVSYYERSNFQVFKTDAAAFYSASLFCLGRVDEAAPIFAELMELECKNYEYLFYFSRHARNIDDKSLGALILGYVQKHFPEDHRIAAEYKNWLTENVA
ncbi:hypothetical protein ACVBGC_27420 [Burkholderia stagnalis]